MNNTPKTRRAFTLVELLVVVLILAILMAVALPLYLGAIKNSETATARANMQTIANANQAYRVKNPNVGYTDKISDLAADLGSDKINGPGTRTYSIDKSGAATNCLNGEKVPDGGFVVYSSEKSDGCFVPGVSTN